MKFNEFRCPSLCSQNCNDRALDNAIRNIKPPYYHHNLSQKFFKCFCERICTRTKRLNMERSVVYEKLKSANPSDFTRLFASLNTVSCSKRLQETARRRRHPSYVDFLKKARGDYPPELSEQQSYGRRFHKSVRSLARKNGHI